MERLRVRTAPSRFADGLAGTAWSLLAVALPRAVGRSVTALHLAWGVVNELTIRRGLPGCWGRPCIPQLTERLRLHMY